MVTRWPPSSPPRSKSRFKDLASLRSSSHHLMTSGWLCWCQAQPITFARKLGCSDKSCIDRVIPGDAGELLAPPELHGLWVGILQQDQKPLSEAEWVDDIENSNNTFPLYKKLAFSPRPDFPLCFYFQVSQPGHCWHLRPDNSVMGSVLCNVKSLATSLASACWVPVVSPFPPPPSCDNQRCPLGAKITQVMNHCVTVWEWWAKGDYFIIHQGKDMKGRQNSV